jgi:hypothetical protein
MAAFSTGNPVTRALNVSRPVRCGKCSSRFVRSSARERLCLTCKPAAVRARSAASRPRTLVVPDRLAIEPARVPADSLIYTAGDRRASVVLALKLASAAASDLPDHAAKLVAYARSVARGVVPGSTWQLSHLGYRISPCTGEKNPCLLPRPDQPETAAEAEQLTGYGMAVFTPA